MTDKQHETRQDTQKAAGELQGAPDGMNTQKTGRNKPRGRGGGRGHTRRHTAATDHTAGAGAEDKRREDRKGGRREGHGWPCAWRVEEGNTAAGREQGEIRQTEKRDI